MDTANLEDNKHLKENVGEINKVHTISPVKESEIYFAEYQQSELRKKKLPKEAGVYVQGRIEGIDAWIIIDTGASRTIVSKRLFKSE